MSRTSRILLAASVVLIASCRDSQARTQTVAQGSMVDTGFVTRTTRVGRNEFRYQVFTPRNFDKSRQWPVIVALAGSDARGTDGDSQTHSGFGLVLRANRETFPAVVVFPQVPPVSYGITVIDTITMQALDATLKEFNGDPDRVYLTGVSLGAGVGVDIAVAHPDRFAAFVMVSGGLCKRCVLGAAGVTDSDADEYAAAAQRLRNMPVWITHGDADTQLPPISAELFGQALQRVNGNLHFNLLPGVKHEAWRVAYGPPLLTWLFAQKRSP